MSRKLKLMKKILKRKERGNESQVAKYKVMLSGNGKELQEEKEEKYKRGRRKKSRIGMMERLVKKVRWRMERRKRKKMRRRRRRRKKKGQDKHTKYR